MGTDKALLSIAGVPLLVRVCEFAIATANSVLVVTPWGERYREILPPECAIAPEPQILGATESPGPLVGFKRGLTQVETEWVLLLACDLPALNATEAQVWLPQLAAVEEEAIALLPRHPKGWEPLCGFYRRRCLSALEAYVAEGGRSFQGWLTTQRVAELDVGNRQVLLNCNTPQDLERARSLAIATPAVES